jgi:hypothetical protein
MRVCRLRCGSAPSFDAWRKQQDDQPSRSEAIRLILEQALSAPPAESTKEAQNASELADQTAERLVDKSMPPEEQQRRKRALIKGPRAFHDIREDLPRPKR